MLGVGNEHTQSMIDGGRNSKYAIFSWPPSSTRTILRLKYGSKSSLFFKSSTLIPSLCATFSSSCGDSSVWIWPRKLAGSDIGVNPIRHCPDGKHRVHHSELLLAAPVQNVGISRKHMQHLGCARRPMRRLNVLHQVGELVRGHVVECIRLALLRIRVLLSRCKLIEGDPRPSRGWRVARKRPRIFGWQRR